MITFDDLHLQSASRRVTYSDENGNQLTQEEAQTVIIIRKPLICLVKVQIILVHVYATIVA